ncbi:hypothetical protein [Tautonia sociabilis]|uniref:Uncharacterized protein n=1 Tax=Tautonia sociabilis TaxID=2080755 RepID=A0A432MRF5_9BACT|nr:hypothetical protein [Tautonia sociabilis]RUL89556.1 hypothetical protein TsocGM_01940 [Tautonia sociabilis]
MILAALASLAGCAEELGPEPMPTAPVAGRVVLGGRPITQGWLEFLPVEGTVGRLRSARILPDGSFKTDGVAVGTVAIRISGGRLPAPEERLFGRMYLIRRSVPESGAADLVIDLDRERLRLAANRSG